MNDGSNVRDQLREKLLGLPFSSFLRCLADLLERMGYSDVSLSSRKDWRGRNGKDGNGGYDLSARLNVGGVARRIAIQAKQFDDSQRVYLSQVDALRGVCLRAGATEGLLLTTGPVSSRIPRTILAATSFAPVRVVDGAELHDLLFTHLVGIWQERGNKEEAVRYGVDEAYFAGLAKERKGNSRDDCVVAPPAPAMPQFLVTVAINPASFGQVSAGRMKNTA